MKVWINRRFKGHYPVGTAAVVVAETAEQAADLLNVELLQRGLLDPAMPEQFERLLTNIATARVLCDGNY